MTALLATCLCMHRRFIGLDGGLKMFDRTWLAAAGLLAAAFFAGSAQAQLASGTYRISSDSVSVDGGFAYWGNPPPGVQFYMTTSTPFQEWIWNGSTFENFGIESNGLGAAAGPYLVDAGNGTATEAAQGDPFTATAAGGGCTLLDTRTGNYRSNNFGVLAMSSTPTVWASLPCCVYGNHGAVRGRPQITPGGTIVAEDGCILRGVAAHPFPFDPYQSYWSDINWWQNLHDIGHFNIVRVGAWLGTFTDIGFGPTTYQMDIPTLEGVLDTMISNAAQAGMYVMIDEHSTDSPTNWEKNRQFWTALAPRYANNTNVIYELKNEPDPSDDVSDEATSYNLIRSLAPSTPIIMNSWCCTIQLDQTDGVVNLLNDEQTAGVDFTNAVAGYHPYLATSADQMTPIENAMQAAGFPIYMTEFAQFYFGNNIDISYLEPGLGNRGISWGWYDGLGFNDADNGIAYGCCFGTPTPINVTWPSD